MTPGKFLIHCRLLKQHEDSVRAVYYSIEMVFLCIFRENLNRCTVLCGLNIQVSFISGHIPLNDVASGVPTAVKAKTPRLRASKRVSNTERAAQQHFLPNVTQCCFTL